MQNATPEKQPLDTTDRISPGLVLRVWLLIGMQSFGGGTTTLALIRQAVVDRHGWLTEGEFTRYWALCQLAPGINLLAFAVLIGRKLAGTTGIFLALLGMLLPSVAITLLLTAFFERVQGQAGVQAALRGVIPATVGLGLLTAIQMACPLLQESRREGRESYALSVLLLAGSGVALAVLHIPVFGIMALVGAVGAGMHWRWSMAAKGRPAGADRERPE